MFLVSSGFSLEKSGDLVWGSDSPVSEELSTCMEESTTSYTAGQMIQQWQLIKHQTPQTFLFYPTTQPIHNIEKILRNQTNSSPSIMKLSDSLSLLTLQPCADMIRRSAGILSPPFTSTRSPTTTPSALMLIFSPFLTTRACWKTVKKQLTSKATLKKGAQNIQAS